MTQVIDKLAAPPYLGPMASHAGRSVLFRTTVLLVTLSAGLLSTGIDLLEDHAASPKLAADHSENGARPLHLIAYHAAKPTSCNVCYFQKLLGHGLFPVQQVAVVPDVLAAPAPRLSPPEIRAEFNPEVNRGPPQQI